MAQAGGGAGSYAEGVTAGWSNVGGNVDTGIAGTVATAGGSGGPQSGGRGGDDGAGGFTQAGTRQALDAGAAGVPNTCIDQPEICNGIDDNCNGISDDGCPSSLLESGSALEPVVGDSKGGSSFADVCSANEMIVGIEIGIGLFLGQVTAICQKYTLKINMGTVPYEYSIALGAAEKLPPHPGTTGDPIKSLNCAAGSILVGLRAEQQSGLIAGYGYPELTSISIECAVPAVDFNSPTPTLIWAKTVIVGPVYGSKYDSTKATLKANLLAQNAFATGLHGSGGQWVDNVGMISSSVRILVH